METPAESSSIHRVSRLASSCVAATALLVAFGIGATSPAHGRRPKSDPLDLTDDLYHRVKAGLFQPTHEPLVLRVTRVGKDAEGDPVPGEFLTFSRDQGSFAVRTDSQGAVVVHLDLEAALSHLTVTTLAGRGLVREFEEDPRHPIR